jgi:hypothetical protein
VATPNQRQPRLTYRKPLAWILAAVFVLSMIMGTGPGVALVNRPHAIFGVPLVYAWGIFWYLIQVVVALIAYFALWESESEDDEPTRWDSVEGDQR